MTSEFVTNDGVVIAYSDTDGQNEEGLECLILVSPILLLVLTHVANKSHSYMALLVQKMFGKRM